MDKKDLLKLILKDIDNDAAKAEVDNILFAMMNKQITKVLDDIDCMDDDNIKDKIDALSFIIQQFADIEYKYVVNVNINNLKEYNGIMARAASRLKECINKTIKHISDIIEKKEKEIPADKEDLSKLSKEELISIINKNK